MKGIVSKVIAVLIEREKTLGYDVLHVNEIYEFNIAYGKCFEKLGFVVYEKTEKKNRFLYKGQKNE